MMCKVSRLQPFPWTARPNNWISGSSLILRKFLIGSAGSLEFALPVLPNFFRCTLRHLSEDRSDWMGVRLNGVPRWCRSCRNISRPWADGFCTAGNSRQPRSARGPKLRSSMTDSQPNLARRRMPSIISSPSREIARGKLLVWLREWSTRPIRRL